MTLQNYYKILNKTNKMNKIFTIKERIFYFLENQGIKKEEFYRKVGIARANFSGTGKNSELGGDKIVKILNIYSKMDANWLLTGNGEMIKNNEKETIQQPIIGNNNQKNGFDINANNSLSELKDLINIIKQQITNKDQVIDNLFEQIKQKDEQIYKLIDKLTSAK